MKDAAFMGLAPDGGLFMPECIPAVDMQVVMEKAEKSFAEMAAYIAGLFFGEEIPEADLYCLCRQVFSFPLRMHKFGNDKYTLELFHGPTFAFKDFGAGFMGKMMGLLHQDEEDLVILTATSGDTGSAVAHGFYDVPGIQVVILYPEGKVSPLQESQMTTLGKNIFPLKVKGNFDDCQSLVKQIFNDREFRKKHRVTSANSINLLRWIPQSFYYFYGYYLWQQATGETAPDIIVPSGNYGNIAAGILAWRMGLPVGRFIAASNANDVVPRYLQTGEYQPRPSVRTVANAMDVGDPSNYERIMYLFQRDFEQLATRVKGFACDDKAIRKGLYDMYRQYGYVSDPHSVVGYLAAMQYRAKGFWLSTAHEAKFREISGEVLPVLPELPQVLQQTLQKERHFQVMEASAEELKKRLDTFNFK